MRLKKQIEQELNLPVRLRAGAPGSLNIFVNGEQVYSKRQTGRMPSAEEVIRLMREKMAA